MDEQFDNPLDRLFQGSLKLPGGDKPLTGRDWSSSPEIQGTLTLDANSPVRHTAYDEVFSLEDFVTEAVQEDEDDLRTFPVRLTDSQLVDGPGGRYINYAWRQVAYVNDAWADVTDGEIGTFSERPARNRDEINRRHEMHDGLPMPTFGDTTSRQHIVILQETRLPSGAIVWFFTRELDRVFPVSVSQNGGSAGDASTQCSFTYDLSSENGAALGYNGPYSPLFDRPAAGRMVAALHGTAFWNNNNEIALLNVDEVFDVSEC